MKDQRTSGANAFFMGLVTRVMLLLLATAISSLLDSARAADHGHDNACAETSTLAQTACYKAAAEAYNLALGTCENRPEGEQSTCEREATHEQAHARGECDDQYQARQDVCEELGGGPYNPPIVPGNFVDPGNSPQHPYFPLHPRTYTYKSFLNGTGKAIEQDVVQVTNKTQDILGISCRVVRDIVTDVETNLVTEDTTDWYALDKQGTVWYCGEIAQQYEDGILVSIDGSWRADKEGAKPGQIMLANPQAGDVYRQEFALSEAEDVARVIGKVQLSILQQTYPVLNKLPDSLQKTDLELLHTQDFSALEPGSVLENQYEDKYYAPGVGLILTIANDGTQTQEVLVEIGP
jgi:hypothetical protein